MRGCTSGGYDQLETSPETIEQELRPGVCERRQTYLENYCIDNKLYIFCLSFEYKYTFKKKIVFNELEYLLHRSADRLSIRMSLLLR